MHNGRGDNVVAVVPVVIIIIIIIIINEKINVAFSRRTARTRNSHKKHKPRKRRVQQYRRRKNSHENDCSKSSVFSCRLNISNDGCDVSVAGCYCECR